MNSLALARATRKVVRPFRRLFQSPSRPADLSDFKGSVLVLIAHPDDEVFCSGLVCELLTRGLAVHLVCFTRGEGGERGDIAQDAKLAQIREEEMKAAAKALGFTTLTFLDYTDPPAVGGQLSAPQHDSAELLAEFEQLVQKHSIAHLITHGSSGEYWHPAHLCLHRHARILNRRLPRLQLWTFNAWTSGHLLQAVLNQDDPSHLTVDAADYSETRLKSLSCHFSQKDVFQRFADGTLADFLSLTAQENYRKW